MKIAISLALAGALMAGCSSDSEPTVPDEPTPTPTPTPVPDAPENCTSTDVGISFQAINATVVSDPDAAPSELIDGCVDRAHSWSGDYGSIVTLDAGSVHQMQGVYIWSTFARMEWIKIESSADGINWITDIHSIPTKPVSESVYYGLDEAGSTRYVRLTGFGSDLNNWTNITEVRWSLSGYNVSGERVLKDTSASLHESFSFSDHLLLPMMSQHTAAVSSIRQSCPYGPEPSFTDITGLGSTFLKIMSINGSRVYLIDWDHYPRMNQGAEGYEGALEPYQDYESQIFEHPDFSSQVHFTGCDSSGRADQWYGFTPQLLGILNGSQPSLRDNWK